MAGTDWSPEHYLRFGDERTRPAIDLVSHIRVDEPAAVVDLGCGPGNSTAALRRRWPGARLVGVDNSPEMISAAKADHPEGEWVLSSIEDWAPAEPFDVVFSNAALQWVPRHGPLVERLFGAVSRGGALAFQIPSADYARVRALIEKIAQDGPWAPRMTGALSELTMEPPSFYYDRLAPLARSIDAWETTYFHVMESPAAIVEWISSTGLRPFLAALEGDQERQEFLARFSAGVADAYAVRADGRVLFPFTRTFFVAYA